MVLLDTHVLIWMDSAPATLGARTRAAIDRAATVDALAVSAISYWEIAILIDKGRLTFAAPLATWRERMLADGIAELALRGDIGIGAVAIDRLASDPADRMIVATALIYGASLITADANLLAWPGPLSCQDART